MTEKHGHQIAQRLSRWANRALENRGEWVQAMAAEADHTAPGRERWWWWVGIVFTLLRSWFGGSTQESGERPLELTATAFYLIAFALYVSVHLALQAVGYGIREPWSEAWFPLVLCFVLAAVPAVIAMGVWVCDDLARMLAAAFTLFDLTVVILFAHRFGFSPFRTAKFVCDLACLAAMFTPRVQQACRWEPADPQGKLLHL